MNLFSTLAIVLLQMITFEKIFKTVTQNFAIQSVNIFCSLVIRNSGGFLLNYIETLYEKRTARFQIQNLLTS